LETGNWLAYAVPILAIVVVLLTSLVKNVDWSPKAKNLVATVVSVAGSALFVLASPDRSLNDAGDFLALSSSAYGASQLLYQFILRGTSVEQKLAETKVL